MNHAKAAIVISNRTRETFLKIAEKMHLNEDMAIRQAILEFISNHAKELKTCHRDLKLE